MKPARLGLLGIILASLLLVGCEISMGGAAEPPTPTPIPTPAETSRATYKVVRGPAIEAIEVLGRVVPVREANLYFKTNGRLEAILVDVNKVVKKGDVLAQLETGDLSNQIKQAQVAVDVANIKVAQAQADIADQRKSADEAKKNAQEELTIAKAGLEKARIALEKAQGEYDKIAWRDDRGSTSQAAALQQATLDFQSAQATYNIKERNLNKVTTIDESSVQLLQKDVEKARLAVDKLVEQADLAKILSPYDGIVMSTKGRIGDQITAYTPMIVVADPSELELSADIQSAQLMKMKLGMPATLNFSDFPGTGDLPGKVTALPYQQAGQTTATAGTDNSTRFRLDKANPDLKTGMLAKIKIELQRKENALLLPPAAIRSIGRRRYVVVLDGDRKTQVDVEIGIQGDKQVEVLTGVTEGQTIVGQ